MKEREKVEERQMKENGEEEMEMGERVVAVEAATDANQNELSKRCNRTGGQDTC